MNPRKKDGFKSEYSLKSVKLNQTIQNLVRSAGKTEDSDLLCQMMTTVLKLQTERVERGDLKILNAALKELRWAFRVFRPYRHVRKVSVFGSARLKERDLSYRAACTFGKIMAQSGWMIITGASTGIMRAGNEGAGRELSFGVNIRLPFEQAVNAIVENDRKLIHFKYFFTRKLIFIKESDAICLFPGGFGTLDEGFEVLTLVQTGKAMPRPIVMVEDRKNKYWQSWLRFVRGVILKKKMIEPSDLGLFEIVATPQEARDSILAFYRNYHSMRFVGDQLVIRIQKTLSSSDLQYLNRKFKGIVVKGKIVLSGPLVAESNEQDTSHLSRLVFHFDRRSYGRLRQLVNAVNHAGE